MLLAVSVLVGVVVFVLTSLALKGNWSEGLPLRFIIPAVWAMNMLVLFSLGAYFLDYERLYLIGVLYALPVPVDFWLHELTGINLGFIAFAVPAAVILIIELVCSPVCIAYNSDHEHPGQSTPHSEPH